ncbi:hypothetical protein TKK_0017135 [Trichogramma kaykai]
MGFFRDNTTTRYTTRLSQPLNLVGEWSVALTEIHMPMTFQHISSEDYMITVKKISKFAQHPEITSNAVSQQRPQIIARETPRSSYATIRRGLYSNVSELVSETNTLPMMMNHLRITENPGKYIHIQRVSGVECCDIHEIYLPEKILQIFGFDTEPGKKYLTLGFDSSVTGSRPSDLSASLPKILLIYTDIIEPIFTGDIQAKLLRCVSIGGEKYRYGFTEISRFSPPMYIPLLYNSFQTIEIDIRDQHGQPIPFDCGTLTEILHFKRMDQ